MSGDGGAGGEARALGSVVADESVAVTDAAVAAAAAVVAGDVPEKALDAPMRGGDDAAADGPPRVAMCYTDHFGVWPLLHEAIAEHMPLRNLPWKFRGSSSNYHTIAALEVAWFPQDDSAFNFERTVVNWYRMPYGYVFLVRCERFELYKTQVRPLLKAWVEEMVEKGVEWLIVYVPLGTCSDVPGIKGKVYRKVYDKIKSDFSSRREGDRSVRIDLYPLPDDPPAHRQWRTMMERLAHLIVQTLSSRSTAYEEEVRRRYEQHTLPGWNFAMYFCVKESLAFMYQQMHLLEETLRQYDELEASFFVALTKGATPGGSGTGTRRTKRASRGAVAGGRDLVEIAGMVNRPLAAGDDAGNVLDVQRKPFRDMILNNTISVLDFRQYLFARQCHLLFALGRQTMVAARALAFITQFSEALADQVASGAVSQALADSWVYSACVNVAEMCQQQSTSLLPHFLQRGGVASREDVALLACTLGSLYVMARQRLLSVAQAAPWVSVPTVRLWSWSPLTRTVAAGGERRSRKSSPHSTDSSNAATSGTAATPGGTIGEDTTSNPALLRALRSSRDFEELYIIVTQAAARHFQQAGRFRFAARLDNETAATYLRRGDFHIVRPLLASQAARYWSDDWKSLYAHTMTHLSMCSAELGRWDQLVDDCLRILTPRMRPAMLEAMSHCAPPASASRLHDASGSAGAVADGSVDAVACLCSFVTELERVVRTEEVVPLTRDLRPLMAAAVAIGSSHDDTAEHTVSFGEDLVVTVVVVSMLPAPVTVDSMYVELQVTDAIGSTETAHAAGEELARQASACGLGDGWRPLVEGQGDVEPSPADGEVDGSASDSAGADHSPEEPSASDRRTAPFSGWISHDALRGTTWAASPPRVPRREVAGDDSPGRFSASRLKGRRSRHRSWPHIRASRARVNSLLGSGVRVSHEDGPIVVQPGATVIHMRRSAPFPGVFTIGSFGLTIGSLTLAETDPLVLPHPRCKVDSVLSMVNRLGFGGQVAASHTTSDIGEVGEIGGAAAAASDVPDGDVKSPPAVPGQPSRTDVSAWKKVHVMRSAEPCVAAVRPAPALLPGVDHSLQVLLQQQSVFGTKLKRYILHLDYPKRLQVNVFGVACQSVAATGGGAAGGGAADVCHSATPSVGTHDLIVHEDGAGVDSTRSSVVLEVPIPPVDELLLLTVPIKVSHGTYEKGASRSRSVSFDVSVEAVSEGLPVDDDSEEESQSQSSGPSGMSSPNPKSASSLSPDGDFHLAFAMSDTVKAPRCVGFSCDANVVFACTKARLLLVRATNTSPITVRVTGYKMTLPEDVPLRVAVDPNADAVCGAEVAPGDALSFMFPLSDANEASGAAGSVDGSIVAGHMFGELEAEDSEHVSDCVARHANPDSTSAMLLLRYVARGTDEHEAVARAVLESAGGSRPRAERRAVHAFSFPFAADPVPPFAEVSVGLPESIPIDRAINAEFTVTLEGGEDQFLTVDWSVKAPRGGAAWDIVVGAEPIRATLVGGVPTVLIATLAPVAAGLQEVPSLDLRTADGGPVMLIRSDESRGYVTVKS